MSSSEYCSCPTRITRQVRLYGELGISCTRCGRTLNPDLNAPCYSGQTENGEDSRTSSPIEERYLQKSIKNNSEVLIQDNPLDIAVRRPNNRLVVDQSVLNQSVSNPGGDSEDDNITVHELLQRRNPSNHSSHLFRNIPQSRSRANQRMDLERMSTSKNFQGPARD